MGEGGENWLILQIQLYSLCTMQHPSVHSYAARGCVCIFFLSSEDERLGSIEEPTVSQQRGGRRRSGRRRRGTRCKPSHMVSHPRMLCRMGRWHRHPKCTLSPLSSSNRSRQRLVKRKRRSFTKCTLNDNDINLCLCLLGQTCQIVSLRQGRQ